jgi:CMP-N,N'-diacetyllegionaminic acid synthase
MMPAGAPILALVPCRKGSRRLAGKNLRTVGGIPLIDRTLFCLARADLPVRTVVSTDDEAVRDRAAALGFPPPFVRPPELATDTASSVDVALHALDWLAGRGEAPAMLLLLQVTSPFREPDDLVAAVRLLSGAPAADAVVGVRTVPAAPQYVFTQDGHTGFLRGAIRESVEPPILVPNGAVYLVRTAALRAQRTFYPVATLGLPMPAERSLDIDTAEDLLFAEALESAFRSAPAGKTAP